MIQAKPSAMFELIQTTLNMDTNRLTVSELCKLANVSRSGYYRWVSAAPIREAREAEDRADFDLILGAYKKRGFSKGARGIQMALLHKEPIVVMNLKKIRRLMDKYGLMCPIRKANPYRRMAKALKTSNVAAYLVKRKFQ